MTFLLVALYYIIGTCWVPFTTKKRDFMFVLAVMNWPVYLICLLYISYMSHLEQKRKNA